jgi:hypothetical protein
MAAPDEEDLVRGREPGPRAQRSDEGAVERGPDDDAADQRATGRKHRGRPRHRQPVRLLAGEELVAGVEPDVGKRPRKADKSVAVVRLEGLLHLGGMRERGGRSGQIDTNAARVIVDRNAKRGVQACVDVADLPPLRDLAEGPRGRQKRKQGQK